MPKRGFSGSDGGVAATLPRVDSENGSGDGDTAVIVIDDADDPPERQGMPVSSRLAWVYYVYVEKSVFLLQHPSTAGAAAQQSKRHLLQPPGGRIASAGACLHAPPPLAFARLSCSEVTFFICILYIYSRQFVVDVVPHRARIELHESVVIRNEVAQISCHFC